jgi:hypothetical protein
MVSAGGSERSTKLSPRAVQVVKTKLSALIDEAAGGEFDAAYE